MLSDDQFRLAFDAEVSRLTSWADGSHDCAHVGVERVEQFWRLSLTPHAANACATELILHRDSQTFDVQFGQETYEGHPIDSFDVFEPLLQAVVDGHVITRTTSSAASGVVLVVDTIVQPNDRLAWIGGRQTAAGQRMRDVETLTRDRHWVPYRRA